MVRLRGCNKCGGDIYLERDQFGAYVACIQCGKVLADLDDRLQPATIDEALELAATARRSVEPALA